ncbi:MAG TPA: Hpt domain-containing protein, partial [Gaiellaceae bacterium]|nr:Hpt domain-containing protein [Gaiellaceae bacterium]
MSLVEVFLADGAERVGRVRAALAGETRGEEELARDIHTFRGAAETVGLARAAALARELDDAMKRGERSRARRAAEELDEELAAVRAGVRTVVCIDDDPTSQLLVERVAARLSAVRLVRARTGEAGLEAIRREAPDLVLLDLTLPDLSGDRVLAELARDPATAGLPVAVVSANARPDRIAELRAT